MNISDPENPTHVREIVEGGLVYHVAIRDNFLFVAHKMDGLSVFDIDNLSNPRMIYEYDTNDLVMDVTVTQRKAFFADRSGGLLIFSQFKSPQIPIAYIDGNPPEMINQGETQFLNGHGEDDGDITGYRWFSSLDGTVGEEKRFDLSILSYGGHIISFSVVDDEGNWSLPLEFSVYVNAQPQIVIETTIPDFVHEGERLFFNVSGYDLDGQIERFQWASNRHGIISEEAIFNMTDLAPGLHNITVQAVDNHGIWSKVLWHKIRINALPDLGSVQVNPAKANENELVRFSSSPTDQDGEVISYRWDSNTLGEISKKSSFSRYLPPGIYNVTFSAKDDKGGWSVSDTFEIVINGLPHALIISDNRTVVNFEESYEMTRGGYDEGEIVAQEWRSDIDGNLGTWEVLNTNILTADTHIIGLRVQDEDGAWSYWTNYTLKVNQAPIISFRGNPPVLYHEGSYINITCTVIDYDGTPTIFNWSSSKDGIIGTEQRLQANSLSPGLHTLRYQVTDDDVFSSNVLYLNISVNARPRITNFEVSNNKILVGETVQFSSESIDPDGTVTRCKWSSNLDGPLSQECSFSTDQLSVGTHNISLKVYDDQDGPSISHFDQLTVEKKTEEGAGSDGYLIPLIIFFVIVAILGVGFAYRSKNIGGGETAQLPTTDMVKAGQAPSPREQSAPSHAEQDTIPATNMATIECPGCQAKMKVPKLGQLQDVRCESCGLEGKAEI